MPDLAVYNSYILFDDPQPSTGQSVNIRVIVKNEGELGAGGFYVEFYNGDPNHNGQLIGTPQYINGIAPGSTASAEVDYNDTSDLYDEQLIVVVVDPNNDVIESRYSNNFAWKILTFSGGMADLEMDPNLLLYDINGDALTEDPCAYQPVAVVAAITNEGARTAGGFDVQIENVSDSNHCHRGHRDRRAKRIQESVERWNRSVILR